MILQRIRRLLEGHAQAVRVTEVRIGLGYTAVLTEEGAVGVAYTPREDLRPGCSPFPPTARLAGRRAMDLLAFLDSGDLLARAAGLAAANALIAAQQAPPATEGDVLEALTLAPDDRVGMVGFFGPLIPRIRSAVAALNVFDRYPSRGPGVEPAERAPSGLPECTVALITSAALIGGTLDPLLRAASRCREVVLLGPSTPLLPLAFADTPVTWLSGIVVAEAWEVLRVVSEGGGTPAFSPYVRKVNLCIRGARASEEPAHAPETDTVTPSPDAHSSSGTGSGSGVGTIRIPRSSV